MLARFCRFLAEPPSPRRAAGLAIGLGIVALRGYLPVIPDFLTIYGENGFAYGANLMPWNLHNGVQVAVFALLFLGSLGMVLRVSVRAATAVVWFAHSWLWLSNSSFYWSWGLLYSDFLFFLFFFVSCSKGSPGGRTAAFWFHIFQVQVCFVYLHSCLYRYDSPAWLYGESLHIAMADIVFGRFTFLNWYGYYPWTAPFAYGAWAVEWMGALFLLFHRKVGPYVVLALTGVHVALELTSMVQAWQFLMIAALVAFWPEAWFDRIEAALHRLGFVQRRSAAHA
jgi:hypothetical protein